MKRAASGLFVAVSLMLATLAQAVAGPDSEYFGTNTNESSEASDFMGRTQQADENQRQNMQGITGYGGRKRAQEAWARWHQSHPNGVPGTPSAGGSEPVKIPPGSIIGAGGGGGWPPPDPKKWAETHEANSSHPIGDGYIVLIWMVPGYGPYKKIVKDPGANPPSPPASILVFTPIKPYVKTPQDIKDVMKTRPTQICAERTQELKEGLEAQGIHGGRCTMAASVVEQNGERYVLITSSDGNSHGLVKPWEIFWGGASGDAEIRAIDYGQTHVAVRLVACGATNYVCENCEDALNAKGVQIATETRRMSWRNQNKKLFPK